mgnify:CR=1 FL=1
MEVIRAKSAGFCFGVKRAVDTVYEQVEKQMGKQIYTYGPIIHNEEVVKDMEAHGVKVLRGEEELKGLEEGLVIIRSHGVPKRICDLMDEKGIEYVDATCPFVKRIHKIVAEESKKGSRIIIIGNPDHPEVEGIRGWAGENVTVIKNAEEAEKFDLGEALTATTTSTNQQVDNTAMVDNVDETLGRAGYGSPKIEGYDTANWALMDYKDIIVHVFSKEDRAFYDLERIWRDGKQITKEDLQ